MSLPLAPCKDDGKGWFWLVAGQNPGGPLRVFSGFRGRCGVGGFILAVEVLGLLDVGQRMYDFSGLLCSSLRLLGAMGIPDVFTVVP